MVSMEEVAVKQGSLHLQQQQTFGKKWRRFSAVLYGESGCALARLELHEGPEKLRRGEAARKVIRLSDCLRVAEGGGEASSPRDTSAFVLETKERPYLLAAPSAERDDWMQAICLLAFPGQRKESLGPEEKGSWPCMENDLYSSSAAGVLHKEFIVTVRPTEASERCRLRGAYTLRTGVTFSFEAGRRCVSGEGNFEFETRQGNEIFLALEDAIAAQKNAAPPGPPLVQATAPAVPMEPPQPESPYSQPHDSLPPQPLASTRAPASSRAPEGEYAVPFDAVAHSLTKSLPGILAGPSPLRGDPLYDSIQEPSAPAPDHIYDEPEGMATLSLYDTPQESWGQAWRRKATADGGPSSSQKDFSALGWPQGTEYDNVVLKKGPK
ncbi:docking protein 2 isoform X2 [Octodon degus]|uniref:Docking protein 2 isoform X2 n=1 Tax=Octodon degus TaxID=10160 RepID=A0A6P6EE68_OCTDE|nr:docking protein 2 isoform X2 [Octodon degus]